jgi:hypothetical protein
MNRREIFDKVKSHLLKQGKRSLANGIQGCVYKGPDGLMCALGPLLPDDVKDYWYNGRGIKAVLDTREDIRISLEIESEEDITFLQNLQTIHDSIDPSDWEYALNQFERTHFVSFSN